MNKDILTSLRPALVMTILFAALLGMAYPLALTGVGQIIFPSQANGSLIEQDGKVVGSKVIGQGFASDRYFSSRPSAAGKAMTAWPPPARTSVQPARRWSTGSRRTARSGARLIPASRSRPIW